MNDGLEGMERRLAEGKSLADTLVGLTVEDAARRARDRGFVPEELPEDIGAVTTDLRADRLRLFVDPAGRVVRARAG